MIITEIAELVCGKILTKNYKDKFEVQGAFVGDLMSDVLSTIRPEAVLITGLNHPQVIRTALIADASMVIIARGKEPSSEMIELAENEQMPLISSPLGLFEISSRLAEKDILSFENSFNRKNCP